MKSYVGPLSELLDEFVKLKKSLGYKYETEADELYRFSLFSLSYTILEPKLSRELVKEWCIKRPNEGVRNCRRRGYPVRQFGKYMQSIGCDAYIASGDKNANSLKFFPYIFTVDEMERIFSCSDQLCPRRGTTMHLIMPVLLRMVYGCGLRISEAVSLQNKHVNLQEGILEVKNSKFGKDRLIPMSESATTCCRQFFQVFHRYSSQQDYFFMNADRKPITRDNAYRRFREILWASGISHGGKGHGPRVHDLRHTFAVHSLKRAVARGVDVYCALPILSTYLGHSSVAATEQYVRLTADAFPDVREALERYCGHIIPEVICDEAD